MVHNFNLVQENPILMTTVPSTDETTDCPGKENSDEESGVIATRLTDDDNLSAAVRDEVVHDEETCEEAAYEEAAYEEAAYVEVDSTPETIDTVDECILRKTFVYTVEVCARGRGVGLNLRQVDASTLVVQSIQRGGAIEEWNLANPECEVEEGHIIAAVDGYQGAAAAIIPLLRTNGNLRIVFRSPTHTSVVLERTIPRRQLGMKVNKNKSDLMIYEISDGMVDDWIQNHPRCVVVPGDRIIEVNGVRRPPDYMLEMLCSAPSLKLIVVHGDRSAV